MADDEAAGADFFLNIILLLPLPALSLSEFSSSVAETSVADWA